MGIDHPARLLSLTLINCGVLENYRWHRFARIWQMPVVGELAQLLSNSWVMRKSLNRVNPKPLPRSFIDRIMRYADWGHKRAVLKLYRNSRNLNAAFPELVQPTGISLVPTCVIWGDGDIFLPVKYAEKQRKYFPNAEVHVLHGLGHWPFIDDVAAVRKPLEEFLARQVKEQRPSVP